MPHLTTQSKASNTPETDVWSSLLKSVTGGKRLPEKHMILLGPSPSLQRDLIEILATDNRKPHPKRIKHQVPVANDFALGYTYLDVLDTDKEDILARLSIHTLPKASPSLAPLLVPLLTSATVPETLAVILLDFAEPWNWVSQLRQWVQMLKEAGGKVDDECRETMNTLMQEWQEKRRGGQSDAGIGGANAEQNVSVPLGQGEWDEPLGVPLCVICHNSEKIDFLEKECAWREEEFDYLLQFLRTVLLKHGASLVYTSNTMPNSVPLLLRASLGIRSSLTKESLKHNVVDRDKILIPPNWDSWGKIRVLREAFDLEGVSSAWTEDISGSTAGDGPATRQQPNSVSMFNITIQNPRGSHSKDGERFPNGSANTETPTMQDFLASQVEAMEQLKAEEEAQRTREVKDTTDGSEHTFAGNESARPHVDDHIGSLQYNIGGIQVDAEDVLRRIKENALEQVPEQRSQAPSVPATTAPASSIDPKENQQLSNFFSSLIKRGASSSPGTPQSSRT